MIVDGVLNYFAPAGLTSYEIPNSVTSIGSYAFYECSSLTSVEIPNTVTAIGWSAFSGCSGLTSVEIPNSVTSIESGAFYGCTSLPVEGNLRYADTYLVGVADKTISTNAIKEGTKWIGTSAFSGCTNLTSVNIPTSVTEIGTSAFYGCTNLTSVNIPTSVTEIGDYSFYGCTSLTSVDIPCSVASIRYSAFGSCSALASVTVENSDPANITLTGTIFYNVPTSTCTLYVPKGSKELYEAADQWKAFGTTEEISNSSEVNNIIYYTSSSPEGVVNPNKTDVFGANIISNDYNDGQGKIVFDGEVTSIGDLAFKSSFLTSVTIPNSVTTIGESAFNLCTMLTSVEIPGSVTSIGGSAFYYCKSLTSATIGNSVTSIGEGAFNSCFSLKSVTVENDNPANITLGSSVFEEVHTSTCTLYVPKGSKELYAAADQWKDFVKIEELVDEEFDSVITLADGDSYTSNINLNNVDVTYTRTFSSTDWQPLYVPFNMSYEEWSEYGTVAELACVHVYEDGKTAIEFVTVNSGKLLPNVPYVIKPNAVDEGGVTFTCTGKQLKAAPADGEKYISCSSPRYIFKLFGNYQPISASTLAGYGDAEYNGAYVMTAGDKFSHATEGTQLNPYRFYITREKNPNGYWSAPARNKTTAASDDDTDVIYFMVDGQVTGILSVSNDSTDDVKVYNLNGIETRNPHNGVFIKNGKKVYIK